VPEFVPRILHPVQQVLRAAVAVLPPGLRFVVTGLPMLSQTPTFWLPTLTYGLVPDVAGFKHPLQLNLIRGLNNETQHDYQIAYLFQNSPMIGF
jgi:hypothetical protein